jgi:hypothetical protein
MRKVRVVSRKGRSGREESFPITHPHNTINRSCQPSKMNSFVKKTKLIYFQDLFAATDWLLCYIVDKSVRKVEQLTLKTNISSFDLKNAAQVYHLRTLSIVYIQVKTLYLLAIPIKFLFIFSVPLLFVFKN